MKNKIFTTILLSMIFTIVSAQTDSDCNIQGIVYVNVEQTASYKASLQEYFENELKEVAKNYTGSIQLQILVDKNGKACCMSISKNVSDHLSLKIKDLISKMTGWSPAKQNNNPVNFVAAIQLYFSNSELIVSYINEKLQTPQPVSNTNKSNYPDIISDRKTKTQWKIWNASNSLIPSDLSRAIAIDSNGIIWYCSDNGIVRITEDDRWQIFNGKNVKALAGKNNSTFITDITIDNANNVWACSYGDVVKFDGKQWTTFDTTNSPLKLVNKIIADKNGNTWFCTYQGLIKYDGNKFTKYNTANSKLVSDYVTGVYTDNNGAVWIATDKGINKVINDNWILLNKDNSIMPENEVTSIKGDSLGNIWAGLGTKVDNNYLIKIDPANTLSVFRSGPIWNITIDESSNLVWLATNGNGLVQFDGGNFISYDISNSPMPNNTVSDLVIDRNGNKWLSTFGGLVFINKSVNKKGR